jgi:hypothetical protein
VVRDFVSSVVEGSRSAAAVVRSGLGSLRAGLGPGERAGAIEVGATTVGAAVAALAVAFAACGGALGGPAGAAIGTETGRLGGGAI